MFDNFVFGTQAQTASANQRVEDISASPMDCSFPRTTQPASRQNDYFATSQPRINRLDPPSALLVDDEAPWPSIWSNMDPPTPDLDGDTPEFLAEQMSYLSTVRSMVTLSMSGPSPRSLPPSASQTRGSTVACRRLQRQLNVQLQTCTEHARDVESLVQGLVASNQCVLHNPAPSSALLTPPASTAVYDFDRVDPLDPDEDEGFAEMDDDEALALDAATTLRRASTPSGIRRSSVIRFRKSADCVKAMDAAGRGKIRSVPRMRRREGRPHRVPG